MKHTLNRIKQLHTCRKALSSLEFAFIVPMLITLLVGVFETGRFLLINQKADKVSYTVGDLITQHSTLSQSQLKTITDLAANIMEPFYAEENNYIIVTSVENQDDTMVKNWDYTGGGTASSASAINLEAVKATMNMQPDDNIIVVETGYDYSPVFFTGLFKSSTIYKVSYFRPRIIPLTVPPE